MVYRSERQGEMKEWRRKREGELEGEEGEGEMKEKERKGERGKRGDGEEKKRGYRGGSDKLSVQEHMW